MGRNPAGRMSHSSKVLGKRVCFVPLLLHLSGRTRLYRTCYLEAAVALYLVVTVLGRGRALVLPAPARPFRGAVGSAVGSVPSEHSALLAVGLDVVRLAAVLDVVAGAVG